jgi:plastocyanin
MRSATFFGITAIFTAAAGLAACGGDTGAGSTGAGGSTSSTGDTSATTSTSTSTGASTGTGGAAPTLVNGCDPTALEDRTANTTVEIKFGDAVGLKYAPPCIKVKSGTMVTFTGSTLAHPLAPGEIVKGAPVPDAKSPIKATSDAAPSVSFTLAAAGSYPYYCTDHYSSGMQGLIVAE